MGVVGWCVAQNGDVDGGLSLVMQAIDAMQAIRSRHFLPCLFGLLADVHFKAGHNLEATKAVQDGLATAEVTGERFFNADLLRMRGELLARSSNSHKEAAASLKSAIAVAQQQGAKMLTEKAMNSFTRLLD
jgi:predicted ATPase